MLKKENETIQLQSNGIRNQLQSTTIELESLQSILGIDVHPTSISTKTNLDFGFSLFLISEILLPITRSTDVCTWFHKPMTTSLDFILKKPKPTPPVN